MSAQSQASVPPAPGWSVRKALQASMRPLRSDCIRRAAETFSPSATLSANSFSAA